MHRENATASPSPVPWESGSGAGHQDLGDALNPADRCDTANGTDAVSGQRRSGEYTCAARCHWYPYDPGARFLPWHGRTGTYRLYIQRLNNPVGCTPITFGALPLGRARSPRWPRLTVTRLPGRRGTGACAGDQRPRGLDHLASTCRGDAAEWTRLRCGPPTTRGE